MRAKVRAKNFTRRKKIIYIDEKKKNGIAEEP